MKFDKPIALAADHGGYELKEAIKAHLDELGRSLHRLWHRFHRQRGLPGLCRQGLQGRAGRQLRTGHPVLRHRRRHVDVRQQDEGHPRLLLQRYLQRRVYPPPQQRQRPLPGRARRGRGSGLPDRGRLPERRVRGRTPPDAHRQDDGAGKPLSFTLPARQAEYL